MHAHRYLLCTPQSHHGPQHCCTVYTGGTARPAVVVLVAVMYGIRIGLGGAGSNAHTKHDAAALSGATAAKQLLSITPAVTASLADGASPPSASSLLLSRLATASSTPASMPSFDDGALFHVLPVNTSARPVPLSIADTAAEARRLERKQKKAERKKKVQEESKEQTDSQPEIDSAGPVPDLHSGPSEERQQIPPASQDTAAPVLKKKSKEHKVCHRAVVRPPAAVLSRR